MKRIIRSLRWTAPGFDVLLIPFTFLAAAWFRIAKYWGLKNMPATNSLLLRLGVLPVVDHYYEPLFDYRRLPKGNRNETELTGLDLNVVDQLALLSNFTFQEELQKIPQEGKAPEYYYHNGSFQSGDAELYYSLIRHLKPERIIEVGSGFSTLVALKGIEKNSMVSGQKASITCIEPYEMPMLNSLPIDLIRKRVEEVDLSIFAQLKENDMVFIDSSHIIRPGGDVQHVILTILPMLRKGVWIHFHDIFTPANYPMEWLRDEYRLWNEQYMLEAFLSMNKSFVIKCALNFLKNNHAASVASCFPILAKEPDRQPGSFWIYKSQ